MNSPESPENALLAFQESRRATDIIRIAETILGESRKVLEQQGFEHFSQRIGKYSFCWDVLEFSFGIVNRSESQIKLSWAFFRNNFWKVEFRDAIYHLIAHVIAGDEHSDIWEYFTLLIGGTGNQILGSPLPLNDTRMAQVVFMESLEDREDRRLARLQELQLLLEEETEEEEE